MFHEDMSKMETWERMKKQFIVSDISIHIAIFYIRLIDHRWRDLCVIRFSRLEMN